MRALGPGTRGLTPLARAPRPWDSRRADPSYTVSGARDHYREQSTANGLYVERVPDYSNFFSELPTHPSSSYRFKLNDKVPQHVPREYLDAGRTRQEIAEASRPH